jgi:hypothetical protein
MPDDNFAPYAPAKAVVGVINQLRDKGLPNPVTGMVLERIGVAASMTPRTLQGLRFLGLIDEEGNWLENLERLSRAKTEEVPGVLAEIVQAAYLPVFTIVNPATDSDTSISDAFRGFEPRNQRDKMIALFRGLCIRAEIIPASTAKPKGGAPKRAVGGALTAKPRTLKREPVADDRPGDTPVFDDGGAVDIRLITAIIQQLPRERKWSAGRRERWLAAITSAVDLLIETQEGPG